MATAFRLVALLGAVLLAAASCRAQPPVAPPPHPPLAEVVAEYKRLGLPFPPPNAQLVQIDWREYTGTYRGEPEETWYRLAYRVPAAKPSDRPRYFKIDFFGVGFWDIQPFEVAAVEEVKPATDLIQLIKDESGTHLLSFAVQCKERGWDELAEAAYLRAREKLAEDESYRSVLGELHVLAWLHWQEPLGAPGGDRKEALRHLTAIAKEEPSLQTPEAKKTLLQLELTIAPSRSKPGSVESLIDGLTEYWDDPYDFVLKPAEPASYWKLVELGFDAVPALIEHLQDDRLTRAGSLGSQWGTGFGLTVGHLCSRLLFNLSGGKIGGRYSEAGGDRLDSAEARKWFDSAKKIGEEKWLLAHAIPPFTGKSIPYHEGRSVFVGKGFVNHESQTEPHIVRVIGAKYPARLPAIYRTMLKTSVEGGLLNDYVNEVVRSKLPREQKLALLEEGAVSNDWDHSLPALEGLARLDQVRLRKHLQTALVRVWIGVWLGQPVPSRVGGLARLVAAAGDSACWGALLAVTKAVRMADRMVFIEEVVPHRLPDPKDPQRRERIRFLMQFLDDRTTQVEELESGTEVTEVRDYAASRLAGVLDFPIRRTPVFQPVHDATLGPFSRLWLRESVRRAAARELATGN